MIKRTLGIGTGFPAVLIFVFQNFLAAATLLFLAGCPTEPGEAGLWPVNPESRSFYVQRADVQGVYYSITAAKLAEGIRCIIFVADDVPIAARTARNIAAEYDAKIYPKITGAFGDYAAKGYDVDGNGKVIILLLDIKDGYSGTGGYVAGYFDGVHMLNTANSNQADMVFIDVNPQIPGSSGFYVNVAHELQHLINYAMHDGTPQELWLNEGLSSAAEYLYGGHQQGRIDYFNVDPEGTIVYGNNFFVWNGFWELERGDTLANYATAYLFFQWLRIHGGTEIYGVISNAADRDFQAVTRAVKGRISGITETDDPTVWSQLLSSWMVANLVNAPTGLYGYKGEISTAVRGFENEEIQKYQFSPGEGIYSSLAGKSLVEADLTGSGPNIKYLGIGGSTQNPAVTGSSPYSGDVLLTYNANPDPLGSEDEQGFLMAYSSAELSPSAFFAPAARSVSRGALPSSYPIGIHDLRNPDPVKGTGPRRSR
jgi:hypothetical protein